MRLTRPFIALAFVASLAACDDVSRIVSDLPPPFFEDVGGDPHPPSLTLLAIGVGRPDPEPEPEPEPPAPLPATAAPKAVTFFPPDTIVTLRPNDGRANLLTLRVSFADAGGDVVDGGTITVRDLDGPIAGPLQIPPDTLSAADTFESALEVPQSAAAGQHRLEIWAEDAKGSRSPKIPLLVNVELF